MLESVGLSDKEARVYLACLRLSGRPIAQIARESGVKRPTAYVILDALRERGYINRVTIGKRESYSAVNPSVILKDITSRQRALEEIIPDLLKINNSFALRSEIKTYSGTRELIELNEDVLTNAGKLICNWAQFNLGEDKLQKDYLPKQIHSRVERKIYLRSIVRFEKRFKSQLLAMQRRDRAELREICFVAEKDYPLESELIIYGNRIAVFSYQHGVGLSIESDYLSAIMQVIFNMSFKQAKLLEHCVVK